MRYQARHSTTFEYSGPVSQCLTEAHLIPRSLPWQCLEQFRIEVEPATTGEIEHRVDYFGNRVSTFSVLQQHTRLEVISESVVTIDRPVVSVASIPRTSWEEVRAYLGRHSEVESLEAYEFVFDSPFVAASPQLKAYGALSLQPEAPLAEAVVDLSRRIHRDFRYAPRTTTIETPLSEVLQRRGGVCQDFSHVLIGVLRSYGIAARYISGYLRSGAHYTGADASHAWASVYIPEWGWLELDPTNDVIPSDGHVTLAWGRDYGDVTPVKGVSLGGGEQRVHVAVRVQPVE